jgi:hypothetical protein
MLSCHRWQAGSSQEGSLQEREGAAAAAAAAAEAAVSAQKLWDMGYANSEKHSKYATDQQVSHLMCKVSTCLVLSSMLQLVCTVQLACSSSLMSLCFVCEGCNLQQQKVIRQYRLAWHDPSADSIHACC